MKAEVGMRNAEKKMKSTGDGKIRVASFLVWWSYLSDFLKLKIYTTPDQALGLTYHV